MSTVLTIDNHYTTVDSDVESVLSIARSLVSYNPTGAEYRRIWKVPSLFQKNRFPTGYICKLTSALDEHKIEFTTIDRRGSPRLAFPNTCLDGVTLRQYQIEGMQWGLDRLRGIFQWPPGTGKTELLLGLLNSLRLPTLWLVPSKNVLAQTKQRIKQRTELSDSVTVAIPQTLWRWHKEPKFKTKLMRHAQQRKGMSAFNKFKLLIIDECHHTSADTWYKVAMNCPAPFRFGTSATPDTTTESAMKLGAAVSTDKHVLTYDDCYNAEHLSRPHVRLITYHSPQVQHTTRRIRTSKGSRAVAKWDELYDEGIVRNVARNINAVHEALLYKSMGYHPLIIVRIINHAQIIRELCRQYGLAVNVITGDSSTEIRIAEINKLLSNELDVLVSTCILGEGQDMPGLSAIINLVEIGRAHV